VIRELFQIARAIPYESCSGLLKRLSEGQPLELALPAAGLMPSAIGLISDFSRCYKVTDSRAFADDLTTVYEELFDSDAKVDVVWTGPNLPALGPIRETFPVARALVGSAEKRLIIAGYVAHPSVLDKLGISGALRKGASIMLLSDGIDWNDLGIRALMASGVSVIDAKPHTGGVMAKFHAKVIVADASRALVTSANFTYLGQAKNVELGLAVSGSVAERIAEILEKYAAIVNRTRAVAAEFVK
jgi:phosphatidylserine/phosphatidylglycerophosphate/cardiolipin synthase-like enzyme